MPHRDRHTPEMGLQPRVAGQEVRQRKRQADTDFLIVRSNVAERCTGLGLIVLRVIKQFHALRQGCAPARVKAERGKRAGVHGCRSIEIGRQL